MLDRIPPAALRPWRSQLVRHAGQPGAQVGKRHRLARCIDNGRHRPGLRLAEAQPQLPLDIAERRPAIERAPSMDES